MVAQNVSTPPLQEAGQVESQNKDKGEKIDIHLTPGIIICPATSWFPH